MDSADGFTELRHVEDLILIILLLNNFLASSDPELLHVKGVLFLDRCGNSSKGCWSSNFNLDHIFVIDIRIRCDKLFIKDYQGTGENDVK